LANNSDIIVQCPAAEMKDL